MVKHIARLALVLPFAGALVCTQYVDPLSLNMAEYENIPVGFTATYLPASGKVRCTWQPPVAPTRPIAYYTIYRALAGEKLETGGARAQISAGTTTFEDIVGLANAEYDYEIRAAVAQSGSVYVEGLSSNRVTIWVGSGISFSINAGELSTMDTACSLVVVDRYDSLASVQFSADEAFTAPVSMPMNGERLSYPWVLPKGGGLKRAWARIQYNSGRPDSVLVDDIAIRSYRVEIKPRNELRKPNETMRVWYKRDGKGDLGPGGIVDAYVIYRPYFDFGVAIFSDSSFAREFSYGLLFPATGAIATASSLFMTKHRSDSLVGIGAAHDDLHLYRYDFGPDPSNSAAAVNLSELVTLRNPPSTVSAPLALTGFFTGESDTLLSGRNTNLTQQAAYDSLTRLSYIDMLGRGKKEFAVVMVMRGRFFDEPRVVYSNIRLSRDQQYIVSFDAYPPAVKRDWWEFFYPNDGATIEGTVNINLNLNGRAYNDDGSPIPERGLIIDGGGADVSKIELVIASMPDQLASSWNSTSWSTVSYSQLKSYRHRVLPFAIGERRPDIFPVFWDINALDWDAGWYLIAIITEDSFGNRGIAPFTKGTGAGVNYNPQRWRFVTPSVGM